MTGAYSLVLAAEAVVLAASGVCIAFLATRHTDVVLYSRSLAVAGVGLVVGGVAAMLLAVDAGQSLTSALLVLAAVPYGFAGWHIATDAAATDRAGAYVLGAREPVRGGFEEEV